MISKRDEVVALVPAAGFGSRMGSNLPKQYLALNDSSVLDCTLERIRAVPDVSRIVLVVSSVELEHQRSFPDDVFITAGGETRAQSVRNGLIYIRDELKHTSLVLVHDAARPCVRVADINRLIDEVGQSADGGILAIPVHDTLKRSNDSRQITATVDRSNIWRAVTPQLFELEPLVAALDKADHDGITVTDEASAIEYMGGKPCVVECAQDNIKITVPEDLALARIILAAQIEAGSSIANP